MARTMLAVLLTLACTTGAWAAEPAAGEDPWSGKDRAELDKLLGPATKTKRANDGETTLIYKLARLAEDIAPPADMMVRNVPGVGLVGRPMQGLALGPDAISIDPMDIDRHGRATGGGTTERESASISWDPETREKTVTRSGADREAVLGKLTLKFVVDASGAIRSWSVSPKKAASGS